MPTTIDCKFGDVVLVPFPFTDQTASKKRPAVVVSSDAYHRSRPDVIVMAVASQVSQGTRSSADVLLDKWKDAGLLKPSVIKPVVATIEKGLVLRKLGVLQGADIEALRSAIGRIFG